MSVLAARLKAAPRRLAAHLLRHLPPSIARAPKNPRSWLVAARRHFDRLPRATRTLIDHHDLRPESSIITFFQADLQRNAGDKLSSLAARPLTPDVIVQAIDEIIRWKTIAQCAHAHRSGPYFTAAEAAMQAQWDTTIWPIIKNEDFTSTLELACGHGRNTEFLRRPAASIDLVDVNPDCIAACRARFGESKDGCRFRYHLTDGDRFAGIPDASISFGYSWDSMVHFDKLVVQDYVREFARVLKPGGTAFLHHSNYGAIFPHTDWAKNPGSRSDMSAGLMHRYAGAAGLTIKFQRLSGIADGWGIDDLDCLTLLESKDSRP